MKDCAIKIQMARDLHQRNGNRVMTEYPSSIKTYGYCRQEFIKDAEEKACDLIQHLSSLAETDWDNSSDKVRNKLENYGFFTSIMRREYHEFTCAMNILKEQLESDVNWLQIRYENDKDATLPSEPYKDTTSSNPFLSKMLCTIADSKQLLLGLWGYLVGKERKILQDIMDIEESDLSYDLEFYEKIFFDLLHIKDYLEFDEKEEFQKREGWRKRLEKYVKRTM